MSEERTEGTRSASPVPAGTSAATKISVSLGLIAAMVLAVIVNILAARHYKRWDWTSAGLYTLSDATVETLHGLRDPVTVHVLLPSGDALTLAALHLLDAYRGETPKITVELTDPDRHPAEFVALQQRFGVVAGKTEDGKIVTDAAIIVARGSEPHFITLRDLVATEGDDEIEHRPRIEQALTGALRALASKERPKACFTSGHGEGEPPPGAGATGGGLGPFRESLVKNNFAVEDVTATWDARALDACRLLIVAGPTSMVPAAESARFIAYAERGGSLLVAVGPAFDADRGRYVPRGLDGLLALFGLAEREDIVFELSQDLRPPQGYGETFTPELRTHPITEGLQKAKARGLVVAFTLASSLRATGAGAATTSPILVTSDEAFGMADFFAWAKDRPPPVAGPKDTKGPLTIGFAAELPKRPGSDALHGARLVALGSASALYGANWQAEELRGTAVLVESAVAWLAARPSLLDIPTKPATLAGLRVSDAWLAETSRFVILYIPLSTLLLGAAVYFRRYRTERRLVPAAAEPKPPAPRAAPRKSGKARRKDASR